MFDDRLYDTGEVDKQQVRGVIPPALNTKHTAETKQKQLVPRNWLACKLRIFCTPVTHMAQHESVLDKTTV